MKPLSKREYRFIGVPGLATDYYYLDEELVGDDKVLGLTPWYLDPIFAIVLPVPEIYGSPLSYTKSNAPLIGFRLAHLS